MSQEQSILQITEENLLSEIQKQWEKESRIVLITCCRIDEGFELSYTFEKNLILETLRIHVSGEKPVPSITTIYLAGFSHENEIADLYGLTFDGLKINYQGRYIRTSVPHPFGNPKVTVVKGGDKA